MSLLIAAARMIRKEIVVKAPLADVWRAWSSSEGAREFFAPKANIQLEVGGAYEIFFDPADERQSTKGLKLLSYAPLEMISSSGTRRRTCPRCARTQHGSSCSYAPKAAAASR